MPKKIESCYIMRAGRNLSCIYLEKGAGIYRRIYKKDGWADAEKIADDASGSISVNLSENGELFLFCQNMSGDIILHHYNGHKWSERTIQRNLANTAYNLQMHSIVKSEGIHLLYNIPIINAEGKIYKIVSQKTSGNEWLPHTSVVENAADANPVFTVQNISAEHYIVYYQSTGRENSFGYKEFYLPDRWSGFFTLHQTLHSIADKSVVTTKHGIHIALIVKGLYSCQLIYCQKFGAAATAPLVLFEANRIEKVSLSIHDGKTFIIFSAGAYGFFSTVSSDGGKTFTRPARINTNGRSLVKAEYIHNTPYDGKTAVYDLFTDADSPGTAPFLDEIIEGFYTYVDEEVRRDTPPKVEARNEINDLNELLEIKSRKIAILENKLEASYREISDKNRQIMELNTMLVQKNSEIASAGAGYREAVRMLREELDGKNQSIARLNRLLNPVKTEASHMSISSEKPENVTEASIIMNKAGSESASEDTPDEAAAYEENTADSESARCEVNENSHDEEDKNTLEASAGLTGTPEEDGSEA